MGPGPRGRRGHAHRPGGLDEAVLVRHGDPRLVQGAAGALGDNEILLRGLDLDDSQGDKGVVEVLREKLNKATS